jgi:hypothetical protein
VSQKYRDLLRAAGYSKIDTIAESSPTELFEKLIEVNNETEITKRPPTLRNFEK